MLYAAIARRRVRSGFHLLSEGTPEQVLRQFALDVTFAFAGTHALGGERCSIAEVRAWF